MAADGSSPPCLLQADVCVVGAGVAGLALALRLSERNLRVLLLESGDLRHGADAQVLNDGVSEDGDYPFRASRSRGFGGTSRLWYGACIELDPCDFGRRAWLPFSGWPIAAGDVGPYYEATRPLFSIPELATAAREIEATPFHGGGLEAKVVAHSNPRDLGRRFWPRIAASSNVECRFDATVTHLHHSKDGRRLDRLVARSRAGETMSVVAEHFVLACGGIENARLLLASPGAEGRGVGNRRDTVGRYHMEHPMRACGFLPVGAKSRALVPFTDRETAGGIDVIGTFGLSREIRERHGLLDMHLRVFRFHALETRPSVIAGKAAMRRIARGGTGRMQAAARLLRSAAAPAAMRYLAWHAAGKLSRRAPFDHVRFTAFLEQEPDPENRITLDGRRDRFGVPLPRLSWRESDFMRQSHRRSLDLLARAFLDNGLGRFVHDQARTDFLSHYDQYGLHQMGSTRMSDDPRSGVVDGNCRVHGMTNLFMAGSSVFPTGGAANPTWTIAALAFRLGDHISDRRGSLAAPDRSISSEHRHE